MSARKLLATIVTAFLIVAANGVSALAVETTATLDTTSTLDGTTTVTPTPQPGQSFDVPVSIPGANVIVTFTLDDTGKISSVIVTGAPDGSTVVTNSHGVEITFDDNGVAKTIEVEADVQTENGQVVSVTVKTEFEDSQDDGYDDDQQYDDDSEDEGDHHDGGDDDHDDGVVAPAPGSGNGGGGNGPAVGGGNDNDSDDHSGDSDSDRDSDDQDDSNDDDHDDDD